MNQTTLEHSPKEMMVEVAYALPHQQLIIPIKVNTDCTVEEAVKKSGILDKFTEIDLSQNQLGIFGKLTRRDSTLKPMDRVEIYRPLIADPKEVRRQRAADGKIMKKGGGDAPPDEL